MHAGVKKWLLNFVKIAIAVAGLAWVIVHTPWHNQATLREGAEVYGRKMVEGTQEPKVQIGLRDLLKTANPWWLVASWSLLVIPFLVSAWRWRRLMQPQGIFLPFSKCLALTFVGQFYSTFLPGITGGDLVKIIYTSRVIGSKTKSTVTILLDRVIGLIASDRDRGHRGRVSGGARSDDAEGGVGDRGGAGWVWW